MLSMYNTEAMREKRRINRELARGIALGQVKDLTPAQVKECAVRWLTYQMYAKLMREENDKAPEVHGG